MWKLLDTVKTRKLAYNGHTMRKLDGCIVLNKHNTVFTSYRSAISVCYMQHVFPEHKHYLDCFRNFSGLTRWQTDRKTNRPLYVRSKRKERKWSVLRPIQCHLNRPTMYISKHSGINHTVLPANTPCLPFLRKSSFEVEDSQLQLTTHLSTPNGRKAELAWPGWLTYSGQFTHISGHPSATSLAQERESSPAKDRRSTAVPHNQLRCSLIIIIVEYLSSWTGS